MQNVLCYDVSPGAAIVSNLNVPFAVDTRLPNEYLDLYREPNERYRNLFLRQRSGTDGHDDESRRSGGHSDLFPTQV